MTEASSQSPELPPLRKDVRKIDGWGGDDAGTLLLNAWLLEMDSASAVCP